MTSITTSMSIILYHPSFPIESTSPRRLIPIFSIIEVIAIPSSSYSTSLLRLRLQSHYSRAIPALLLYLSLYCETVLLHHVRPRNTLLQWRPQSHLQQQLLQVLLRKVVSSRASVLPNMIPSNPLCSSSSRYVIHALWTCVPSANISLDSLHNQSFENRSNQQLTSMAGIHHYPLLSPPPLSPLQDPSTSSYSRSHRWYRTWSFSHVPHTALQSDNLPRCLITKP